MDGRGPVAHVDRPAAEPYAVSMRALLSGDPAVASMSASSACNVSSPALRLFATNLCSKTRRTSVGGVHLGPLMCRLITVGLPYSSSLQILHLKDLGRVPEVKYLHTGSLEAPMTPAPPYWCR